MLVVNPKLEDLYALSNPSLREHEGSVYEIWEDGEITLQKCGSLYNQRSLHCITPGVKGIVPTFELPEKAGNGHSMMAVHRNHLLLARNLICLLNNFNPSNDYYMCMVPGYGE